MTISNVIWNMENLTEEGPGTMEMSTNTVSMYSSSYESENATMNKLNDLELTKYIPSLVSLVILMLIGIVGNACVVVVYKLKFKRSSVRVYIISLALADMSVCLIGLPYHIIDLTHPVNYHSVLACKSLSYLIAACNLSSVFILLVAGLDRYFKVCRPLRRQIKDFGDRKACVIAICLAALLSVPYAFIYGHSTVQLDGVGYNLTGSECFIDDTYTGSYVGIGYLGFNLLVFVSSVVYLIVIYSLIGRTIRIHRLLPITLNKSARVCFCWKQKSDENDSITNAAGNKKEECSLVGISHDDNGKGQPATETSAMSPNLDTVETSLVLHKGNVPINAQDKTNKLHVQKKDNNKDRAVRNSSNTIVRHTMVGANAHEKNIHKITMMMFTITVAFILTYLPFLTVSIMDTTNNAFWKGLTHAEKIVCDFMLRIYVLNNVCNPFIYSFWDAKFRRELRRCFVCFSKGQSDTTIASTTSQRKRQ
ncbi:cholecystokinin receptor type A-like isoform X1 [Dreissena polymorpha]|uniref:cholecystokinin receptor type A-like isoform X1 n=1 Tax=Dreissena polymorpha TaxID=45954 RepID=UPI0022645EBD|nr:cholecystokinin receptor type A-like isoform X1 [Dreissena polymorpha]XP_052251184.1 cholecystokinin receptor type A-like isoform X1 [Dreissena polymorpha]